MLATERVPTDWEKRKWAFQEESAMTLQYMVENEQSFKALWVEAMYPLTFAEIVPSMSN